MVRHSNFWTYYYTLRKYALYDFITGKDIDVNVKEMLLTAPRASLIASTAFPIGWKVGAA